MKAKKILAVMLGAAMICSLAACGSSSNAASDDGSAQTAETENNVEVSDNDAATNLVADITFEETTVIDDEYCTFTVTGIDPDSSDFWYTFEVTAENKSENQNYGFYVEDAYADGVYLGSVSAGEMELPAGEKVDTEFALEKDDMEELAERMGYSDYTDYTDFEMTLVLYDNDSGDYVTEETMHIYPYGEEKATVYVRETEDTDQVLLDNDSVKVTMINIIEEDDYNNYKVETYVENKSDMTIRLYLDTIVNGCRVGASTGDFITNSTMYGLRGGKNDYCSLRISWDDLTENNIETVETIEGELHVEDWGAGTNGFAENILIDVE